MNRFIFPTDKYIEEGNYKMSVKEISKNQQTADSASSSRIATIRSSAARITALENYASLKEIERFLLEDPRNDVTFNEDGNDYTLEWWDHNEALCSITFWESEAITILKGKRGKTLVRERFTSPNVFQTAWKALLL